jgi:hypothetical protein
MMGGVQTCENPAEQIPCSYTGLFRVGSFAKWLRG